MFLNPLRRLAPILLGLATLAPAQDSSEDAAYRKVQEARDHARKYRTAQAVLLYEKRARGFTERFPQSPHGENVLLWLGDLLKETRPREAHRAYLGCASEAALQRAEDLAFRYEAPPPLEVAGWHGDPVDVTRTKDAVTVVVFFQLNHPQTVKLVPRLLGLRERYEVHGLRLVGVAAVVDDHVLQRPGRIEDELRQWSPGLPVAIDRPRGQGRSVSLDRYRGKAVPWAVFLDRYGRIAWIGGLGCQGNALARAERTLAELLGQPRYDDLVRLARKGEADAVQRLAEIRTADTVDALLKVLAPGGDDEAAAAAGAALDGLLPAGYPRDRAVERWATDREKYRYSFRDDRLVAR